MQRSHKSDCVAQFLLQLAILMCVTLHSANAESLHGNFINGLAYSGEYVVTESSNEDGMRVRPVILRLKIGKEASVVSYTYVADDLPNVKENNLGFILIVVNSGGMEGSVTYNYVIPRQGRLISLGTVQTILHLGKVENIDARPNANLTRDEVNEFIGEIVNFNPSALSNPVNAYPVAALLLLGRGKFLTHEDDKNLSALVNNNEISEDPVLLRYMKITLARGAIDGGRVQAGKNKTIVSSKAYLFDAPLPSSIEKSYLIKGDVVNLIRESSDGQYWLMDYVSAHGIKTEKWIRCEDVNYCN
jgi:hypothetical protein